MQRLILAAFPARFRDRYGAELGALVPECGGGWRDTVDLARAAVREWIHPSFPGSPDERRRLRLQSTTATVFVAWAFAIVAGAVFARSVDDQPVPGLQSWGWTSYEVAAGVFQVAVVLIAVIGFAFWLRVVVPAWRERDYATLKPAVLPVAVVGSWFAVTGAIAYFGHRFVAGNRGHINAQAPVSGIGWTVLALYGVLTIVYVGVCAASCTTALSRSRLSARLLEGSTWMAALGTAALAVVSVAGAVCLSRVLLIGRAGVRDSTTAVLSVLLLLLLTGAALVSTARGLRTLHPA